MYSYFKLANDEFGAPRQCPRYHRASPRPLGGKSQMGLLLQTHVGVLRIVFGHLAHLWPQKSAHPNSRANISILKGKQATRCQEHVWNSRSSSRDPRGIHRGWNECCQWGGGVCKKKSARHYPLLLDVDESWSDKSSGSPKLELATAVQTVSTWKSHVLKRSCFAWSKPRSGHGWFQTRWEDWRWVLDGFG